MFRTLSSLLKGRRIRHESTDIAEHGEHQPSSLAPPHPRNAAYPLTGSTIINTLQGDLAPNSEAPGDNAHESSEDQASIISQQTSGWEDVDLGKQNTRTCEGEHQMMQWIVSPQSCRMNAGWVTERERENTASCSHLQSVSSVHNTEAAIAGSTAENISSTQERTENSTNLLVPLGENPSWNVPGLGLASVTPFPCQQGNRKAWRTFETDANNGAIQRTVSTFSIDSLAEYCRVCQQPSEEPLMELGCQCRGDLAKAHRSCIQQWFNNKGSNKCEVCQQVATNLPPPASQPKQNFWVWRLNRPYGGQRREDGLVQSSNRAIRPVLLLILRRHPSITLLWLFLLIFMTYLFVDVVGSSSVGYTAMAIGFLFGVLVVLGLGTGARLIAECWHERSIRISIQRVEMAASVDRMQASSSATGIH